MATIDPVFVPMKSGDYSFHNGLTAHGDGANMTRRRRVAMTCSCMPTGSVFNGQKNVLQDDYFRSLKNGDVLENDGWNPLIYSEARIGDQSACREATPFRGSSVSSMDEFVGEGPTTEGLGLGSRATGDYGCHHSRKSAIGSRPVNQTVGCR